MFNFLTAEEVDKVKTYLMRKHGYDDVSCYGAITPARVYIFEGHVAGERGCDDLRLDETMIAYILL